MPHYFLFQYLRSFWSSVKIVLQFKCIGTKDFPLEAQTCVLILGLMLFLRSLLNTNLCSCPNTQCVTLGKNLSEPCTCGLQNGHPFLKSWDCYEGEINRQAAQRAKIHHLPL